MMRLECPEGYGWEGTYKEGKCVPCAAGTYSASLGPTTRCIQCPPGTYLPNALSHHCHKCPEWAPVSKAGSTTKSDCTAFPKGPFGDMTATLEITFTAPGDYYFLNQMLWELSGYEAHDMTADIE